MHPGVGERRDNEQVTSPGAWADPGGLLGVLNRCSGPPVTSVTPCVTHVEQIPWRPGRPVDWPGWVPPSVRDGSSPPGHRPALVAPGARPPSWPTAGQDVVVATGTASGKSLAYQLPGADRPAADPRACVLYLAPTKALGADQLQSLESLELPGLRAAAYDGDTPMDDRDWARAHANWVLTNPDMLHRGMLPAHAPVGPGAAPADSTWSSTSATPTAAFSVRTSRWCCAG